MTVAPSLSFSSAKAPLKGSLVILCDKSNNFGAIGKGLDKNGSIKNAIKAAGFKGTFGKVLTILTPQNSTLDRIILLGVGGIGDLNEFSWLRLGGKLSTIFTNGGRVDVMLELPGKPAVLPRQAADMAQGLLLGAYRFDQYKTKTKKPSTKALKVVFHTTAAKCRKENLGRPSRGNRWGIVS